MDARTKQNIGHRRQETIAPACRKLLAGEVAISINRGFLITSRFPFAYQGWDVLGIILHISILHRYQFSTYQPKACTLARPFSLLVVVSYKTVSGKGFLLAQF